MPSSFKIQKAGQQRDGSNLRKYQDLILGTRSLWFFLKFELVMFIFGNLPGALGLLLRKWIYPRILGRVGRGVMFGHHLTFRHPRKITVGDGTIIDDYCMLDAKGDRNAGIQMGRNVYIGRQSILYCKDGDIVLEDDANLGHRSILFSSNRIKVGEGTLLAADCYVMSGGSYDYKSPEKFKDQTGTLTKGPLVIGSNCWLGAKVTVLDGASIGDHSVIGAGAVVTEAIPERSVAVGIPAKVVKKIGENG